MTAKEFIDALEEKDLIAASMADKLRKKVASGGSKPLTAKSLARFLIDKGHVSKPDAMSVLVDGGEVQAPKETEPEEETAPPAEPSGVALPADELQDLSSSAEWSIEESGGGFAEPAEPEAAASGGKKKKKKKKKGKKANEWDSPLLLIGGGSLLLLVVVGLLIWFIMFAENADNILAAARSDMESGSYNNAIRNYEEFAEKYPGNAEYSKARVELAMARIRQTLETGDEEVAFDMAEGELRAVGGEDAFNTAERDLSDLLPRIARGLADDAEASEDLEKTKELADKAETALGMASNTKYIPKSLRDSTELDEIRETLDRIQRRQQQQSDLEEAIAKIKSAVAAGETAEAFAAQEALTEAHPSLMANERLAEAVKSISAAEQQNIQFVEEPLEPAGEAESPNVVAVLAVANRRVAGEAPSSGTYCVQVDSAAYGLDAATGQVKWRRYVGPSVDSVEPLSIEGDVVLVEWREGQGGQPQQTLARVASDTGDVVWRLTLDDQVARPVPSGDQLLLAGRSGKLHVVDAKSGTRRGYVQFAQPLRTPPTVDASSNAIYVVGERSSIYTLSAGDYTCLGVYYTNHARQSVVAPVASVLNNVVLVENDGATSSQLHLYTKDGNGAIGGMAAEKRLSGRVTSRPLVDGRRLTVLTDLGQVSVFEVSASADAEPITLLAERSGRGGQPATRPGVVADNHIWLGENALAKYSISPTGNRLTVVPLSNDYNRSQFLGSLDARDGVLFHTRARRRRAGFTVTACSTEDGKAFWETDLAAPPADDPLASTSPTALIEADANGQVYRFDPAAIRTRVQNESLNSNSGEDGTPVIYQYATLLAQGAAVFGSQGASEALLYSPSAQQPLTRVRLDSALAARPVVFGEGWVAPLSVGQVFVLDAKTGQPLAAPFQPALEAGRSVEWKVPATTDDQQLLLTDGVSKVYLLEQQSGGSSELVAATQADLAVAPLRSGFVPVGNVAIAVAETGEIAVHQLPTLDVGETLSAGGTPVWGPYAAGELVVLSTGSQLIAIGGDGQIAWQVPLEVAKLAGPPVVAGETLVVASEDGNVVQFALADGSETGRIHAGEPIVAGPVLFNGRLVVSARDASLIVLESPE